MKSHQCGISVLVRQMLSCGGGGDGGTSEMLAVFSCCFCSACFLVLTLFVRKWPLWVDSHANE